MANWLCTLNDLKRRLQLTTLSADDALLMADIIEESSRQVEDFCGRHFIPRTETRYFNSTECDGLSVRIDDALALSAVAYDRDDDGLFTESWTADTDYILFPSNSWPKNIISLVDDATVSAVGLGERKFRVTGTFGYGDGESASPWAALGITGTVATTTGTTLTLSAVGDLSAGHTILIGTEQMFVSAVTTGVSPSATVQRGVNVTTAAAHTTAAISAALVPANIRRGTAEIARACWFDFISGNNPAMISENTGSVSYQKAAPERWNAIIMRIIGSYIRLI